MSDSFTISRAALELEAFASFGEEFGVKKTPVEMTTHILLYSQAISLKRIADALDIMVKSSRDEAVRNARFAAFEATDAVRMIRSNPLPGTILDLPSDVTADLYSYIMARAVEHGWVLSSISNAAGTVTRYIKQ